MGNEDINERLRQVRAETVRERLLPLLPPTLLSGAATIPPDSTPAADQTDRARRRSVRAMVSLPDPAATEPLQ